MEVEKRLALASHIQIPKLDETFDCFGKCNAAIRPPLLQNSLVQWRMMIYCTTLRDADNSFLKPYEKYSIRFKSYYDADTVFEFESAVAGYMRKSRTGTYSGSPSPRESPKMKKNAALYPANLLSLMRINQLRVFYFFTMDKDVEHFISNFKLMFSLFQNDTIIAQGSCNPLNGFTLHTDDANAQSHNCTAYLFNPLMRKFALDIKVGICNDGQVDTSLINLTKMNDFNIYIPDNSFFGPYYFPIEWMKLFRSDYNEGDDMENQNDLYKMHLSKAEFDPQSAQELKNMSGQNEFEKEVAQFVSSSTPSLTSFLKSKHNSVISLDKEGKIKNEANANDDEITEALHSSNICTHLPQKKPKRISMLVSKGKENTPSRFIRPQSAISSRASRSIIPPNTSKFRESINNERKKADLCLKRDIISIYGGNDMICEKKQHEIGIEKPLKIPLTSRMKPRSNILFDDNGKLKEKHRKLMKKEFSLLKEIESGEKFQMIKPYIV